MMTTNEIKIEGICERNNTFIHLIKKIIINLFFITRGFGVIYYSLD